MGKNYRSDPIISVSVPYRAKAYCIKCHTNVSKGSILGVISLNFSAKSTQSMAINSFAVFAIIFLIIIVFIIYIMDNKKAMEVMNKTQVILEMPLILL